MSLHKIARPITILRDDLILSQLSKKTRSKLGAVEETGFLLSTGRRDIYCSGGTVRYVLGARTAEVELN